MKRSKIRDYSTIIFKWCKKCGDKTKHLYIKKGKLSYHQCYICGKKIKMEVKKQ